MIRPLLLHQAVQIGALVIGELQLLGGGRIGVLAQLQGEGIALRLLLQRRGGALGIQAGHVYAVDRGAGQKGRTLPASGQTALQQNDQYHGQRRQNDDTGG